MEGARSLNEATTRMDVTRTGRRPTRTCAQVVGEGAEHGCGERQYGATKGARDTIRQETKKGKRMRTLLLFPRSGNRIFETNTLKLFAARFLRQVYPA